MKKVKYMILCLAFTLVLAFGFTLNAWASTANLKMIDAENGDAFADQVTVTWNPVNTKYEMAGYVIKCDDEVIFETSDPEEKTFTLEGLEKGYVKEWSLYYIYENEEGETKTSFLKRIMVNTKPVTIDKVDLKIASIGSSMVKYKAKKPEAATGVNFAMYSIKTGAMLRNVNIAATEEDTDDYLISTPLSYYKNTGYGYRCRSYYTNPSSGKTYYSGWSYYRYFDHASVTSYQNKNRSYLGAKYKLTGVKNIKGYRIYVSSTSTDRGKLTKTVYPKVDKSVTYKVNKIGTLTMKDKKTYYVTIVPLVKKGSNVYPSDVVVKSTIYN